jgi:hypothetical protein
MDDFNNFLCGQNNILALKISLLASPFLLFHKKKSRLISKDILNVFFYKWKSLTCLVKKG